MVIYPRGSAMKLSDHFPLDLRTTRWAHGRGWGSWVEGNCTLDQIWGGCGGRLRSLGQTACCLSLIPLAAQFASLPGNGRCVAGPQREGSARRRLSRGGAGEIPKRFFTFTCDWSLFPLQMVVEDLIDINDKPSVMRSLLLRHRHVNEHQGVLPFTKRKYNSYTSLQVRPIIAWSSSSEARSQLTLIDHHAYVIIVRHCDSRACI